MRNRHDRLRKFGVVALAGIAVLGWVREPEKHQSREDSASTAADFAQSRPAFFPPPHTAGTRGERREVDRLSDDPAAVGANGTARAADLPVTSAPVPTERTKRRPIEADQQTSAVKNREHAPANGGRHEGPQSAERSGSTRSPESREERSLEPEVTDRAERSQDGAAEDALGQAQPVAGKKERSTARSAAIIVGAAAAGAAIGGVTGGGKGAAIGAISGGAGGYVYDRVTRRKGVPDVPTVSNSDTTDQQLDGPGYDRAPSLARRFSTPTFN